MIKITIKITIRIKRQRKRQRSFLPASREFVPARLSVVSP